MSENRFRRLRATLRTAVTWGAAWGIAGGAVVTAIGLFDPGLQGTSLIGRVGLAMLNGMAWGVRFGIVGAVMGTVFSTVVRLRCRGKQLADISPVRFGILGAVVCGVGVPLYLQTMNVLSGGAIPWRLVTDDGLWAAVFGGAAAAGSILLARRADTLPDSSPPDELESGDDLDALLPGDQRQAPLVQRSRSAQP